MGDGEGGMSLINIKCFVLYKLWSQQLEASKFGDVPDE